MKQFIFGLIFLLSLKTSAQTDSSLQVLTIRDLINLVLTNHPVLKQANLNPEFASAELKIARGAFDPKLSGGYDLKNFKGTEYWNLLNGGIKVPTWFPIDPKVEIDRNRGDFIGPESSIPTSNDNRQISAGISLPIGQGLFIDRRRATVKQAKIYQQVAEAEQIKMVNKILLTAIKDYWEWSLAYQQSILLERSILLAEQLFNRTLSDYSFGEAAVVDTIQAKITYQSRKVDYEKIKFDLEKSKLMIETHLWSDDLIPVALLPGVVPDTSNTTAVLPSNESIISIIEWAEINHPELRKISGKISQLEIEKRWNRESLKPNLDLSYSFIDAPLTPRGDFVSPEFDDNYKFSVDFSFPIYLRKERGKLQKTNLKILDGQFELKRQRLMIRNNILAKQAELNMSNELTKQYSLMAENYNRLLEAELLNLRTGESDLFKINIQQDKYIESQLKYLQSLIKLEKAKVEILYEAGLPRLSLDQL